MVKNVLEDIGLFQSAKTNKKDFTKFFIIRKATKNLPAVALMIEAQTEKTPDDTYKTLWGSLGVIISENQQNIFYEANNVVLDEFFSDTKLKKTFLKSLNYNKEIKCELESKSEWNNPEDIDFDAETEEIFEDKKYSPKKVLKRVEDTFFKIYNG